MQPKLGAALARRKRDGFVVRMDNEDRMQAVINRLERHGPQCASTSITLCDTARTHAETKDNGLDWALRQY